MTKQEAIDILRADFGINIWQTPNGYDEADFYNAYDIAIECIEKQIPKKPIPKEYNGMQGVEYTYNCPNCGVEYNKFYIGRPYCMYCGQAIDWSDNE